MRRAGASLALAALLLAGCAHEIRVDTPAPAPLLTAPAAGAPVAVEYVGVRFSDVPDDVRADLLLLIANHLRKSGLFENVFEYAVSHEAPPEAARLWLVVDQHEKLEGMATGMLKALLIIYSVGLLDPLAPYHYAYSVRLDARFETPGGARSYRSEAAGAARYSSLFSDARQVGLDTRAAVLDRALARLMHELARDPARAEHPEALEAPHE